MTTRRKLVYSRSKFTVCIYVCKYMYNCNYMVHIYLFVEENTLQLKFSTLKEITKIFCTMKIPQSMVLLLTQQQV